MPDRYQYQTERPDEPRRETLAHFPPLPPWLQKKLLRADEEVTWVRGPRWCPAWERYATHAGVFLVGLALGFALIAVGSTVSGSFDNILPVFPILALITVVGSICLLGIFNGHFTRLVVTNQRIVIMQGYEIRRTWKLDALPRSLVRLVHRDGDEEESRSVDLGALQSMLGGSGDGFVEAKAVWALGKQLDQFKKRDRG